MIKVFFKTNESVIEKIFHSVDLAQKWAEANDYKVVRAKRMNSKKRKEIV